MNEITISDTNLNLVTYNQQPVVTFEMIDKTHQRPSGTSKRNFARNKQHFIEGEDFYNLSYQDVILKDEFRTAGIVPNPKGLMILTETGYLMLVKSFRDDLAWQVQRELIKKYFTAESLCEEINTKIVDAEDDLIIFVKRHKEMLELFNINPKLTATALNNAVKQKFGVSLLENTWGLLPSSNKYEETEHEKQLDVKQLSVDLKMDEDKVEQYLKHLNINPTEEYEAAFMVIKEYIRMSVHCNNPLL